MAVMGKYCKVYQVGRLREFDAWTEQTQNLRKRKEKIEGEEIEIQKELTDDDILYLQENFTVTDGIFLDQAIIFDQVTPEWKAFCEKVLDFHIPAQ